MAGSPQRRYRAAVLLAVVAGLFGLSGANCNFLWPRQDEFASLPAAIPPSPTLEQVIQAVNANNGRIQSFSARHATLSGTGFPTLQAAVEFQRPMRFRLRGQTRLTGPEIDLGSNDELFWFWVRLNQPPAIYYCRHDQFAASPVRRSVPVDPYWLVEALGIAELDPALPHQGPFPLRDGRLEIRTIRETPDGIATKITVVDARHALILEQRLYDSRNQLLAGASAGRYRRDPWTGLFMPTVVEVRTPATQNSPALVLQVHLGSVEINRPVPAADQLWAMPVYENAPPVDLCNPSPPPGSAPPPVSRRQQPAHAQADRPRY